MLLEIKNIHKKFLIQGREVRALEDVSVGINAGESLGLVGESGCGKTTLARILMGLVKPDKGEVLFEGKSCFGSQAAMRNFRRKVRMVFQDPFAALDPRCSVKEVLAEALVLEQGLKSAQALGRMTRVLPSVGLSADILSRHPHEFSGGERQRICIARALMTDPELLILDEAVSSLDVLVQGQVLETLEQVRRDTGVTFLFISHNLRVVRKICSKIAVMQTGKIVEYGSVGDVMAKPGHPYTQGLLKAAFEYTLSIATDEIDKYDS